MDQGVVVISPANLSLRIDTGDPRIPVRVFRSHPEYLSWRKARSRGRETIEKAVAAALADLRVRPEALPARLQQVLRHLSALSGVPSLKQLESAVTSRRTFFRIWSAIPEHPSRLLRRVRLRHAQDLIRSGVPDEQAAREAGYASAREMNREMAVYGESRPAARAAVAAGTTMR